MSDREDRKDGGAETVAEIVAEMRRIYPPGPLCEQTVDGQFVHDEMHWLADRIEAAAKRAEENHKQELDRVVLNKDFLDVMRYCAEAMREKATNCNRLGNAAKLREALAALLAWCEAHTGACAIRVAPVPDDEAAVWAERKRAMKMARAALAAPPRNCDVGTAEEQDARFYAACSLRRYCTGCPVKEKWPQRPKSCGIIWSQLPYEAPAAQEGGQP